MSVNFSVTLVIPILNEASSLPELLHAIRSQSHLPNQIIFSDAGSDDGSPKIIEDWWNREGWEGGDCIILARPGAMPGAGRNAGVRISSNSWIAFLDGGITPKSDWLEQLCLHAEKTKKQAVFGVCYFSGQTPFARAICALSYGEGSTHPVVPASLFNQMVFDNIGFFRENLRAGEDLDWVNSFEVFYGAREVCFTACVKYTHFPLSWKQAINKWRICEMHSVIAGVRNKQHLIYFFGLPALYIFILCAGSYGYLILIFYIFARGVMDPVRRSSKRFWWGSKPIAILIAQPLGVILDLSKWLGIMQGLRVKVNIAFRNYI